MPKVLVCMKQVVASDAKIKIDGNSLDESGVDFVTNPYDEFAAEEALQIVEKAGGESKVISVGPDRAEKALKNLLAVGIGEAIRVWGDEFESADVLTTAKTLAAAIKKAEPEFDLVLCGKQAIDQDNHAFAPMLAEFLGIPHVTAVNSLEVGGDGSCTATREIEGATEKIEFSLPAVVSADKGLNEPRYASLKGIMKVKKKKIPVWSASDLELDAAATTAGSTIDAQELPPERTAGKIIDGDDAAAKAKELAKLLREEAKVI